MKQSVLFLLGAIGGDLPNPNRGFGRLSNLLFSDVLRIIGLGLALLLILASIVYARSKVPRKSRRRVSSGEKVFRRSRHSGEKEGADLDLDNAEEESHGSAEDDEDAKEDSSDKRKYKYRVRRRTHRSRNPTLSQIGGLPPAKVSEPSKPV